MFDEWPTEAEVYDVMEPVHTQDDGHEHMWPGDLDHDAVCEVRGCGLEYDQWSE